MDDQPNVPGISEGDEAVSEPQPKSRTPGPEPPPAHESSVPPSDIPANDADRIPVLPESDSTAVPREGEETQVQENPLDAVLEDTVAIAASPDAMEVDAALQPEPNGVTPEQAASEVPEKDEVAQEEEILAEEPPPAKDLPCGDDVEMRDSLLAPDVSPPETAPASPETNGITAVVPQAEVLDNTKVHGIMHVNSHGNKNGKRRELVPLQISYL